MIPIIKAEDVSKRYTLGQRSISYDSLREMLADKLRISRRFEGNGRSSNESFWALKEINFEVCPGEIVGLIGRNGAGKSTLLKILSRITEPTSGRVELYGRVGSLLEIGTGFHPELTGRENIFLNGTILGMSRREIAQKFDEIVAFAEVDRFLDTPVKRYSSGMYVRLAFAVAAHLEPEILIVDEVLAVGDAAFQKKCLGKLSDVAGDGRTVLFVSHNMQAIRQLCTRALWLRSGSIVANGPPREVTEKYLLDSRSAEFVADIDRIIQQLPPDPAFRLKEITLTQGGCAVERVLNGLPLEVIIRYDVLERTSGLRVFFDLCDADGNLLFRSFHDGDNDGIPTVEPGEYVSRAVIPADILGPIRYELRVQAGIHNVRMCTPGDGVCFPLAVELTGRANRAYVSDTFRGKLALSIPWVTEKESRTS